MLKRDKDIIMKFLLRNNIFSNNELTDFDQNKIDMTIDLINFLKSIGNNLKTNTKPDYLTEKGFEQMKLQYVYLRRAVPKELSDEILLEIGKEL